MIYSGGSLDWLGWIGLDWQYCMLEGKFLHLEKDGVWCQIGITVMYPSGWQWGHCFQVPAGIRPERGGFGDGFRPAGLTGRGMNWTRGDPKKQPIK